MSSDRPSDARSPRAEPGEHGRSDDREPASPASRAAENRGAPLVEALERHAPGAREHADATASYAFATAVEIGFDRARCEVAREAAMLHEVGTGLRPGGGRWRKPAQADARRGRDRGVRGPLRGRATGSRAAPASPSTSCGWLLRARERYDGSGPEGCRRAIPIESRLIRAACDARRPAPASTATRHVRRRAAGRRAIEAARRARRQRARPAHGRGADRRSSSAPPANERSSPAA